MTKHLASISTLGLIAVALLGACPGGGGSSGTAGTTGAGTAGTTAGTGTAGTGTAGTGTAGTGAGASAKSVGCGMSPPAADSQTNFVKHDINVTGVDAAFIAMYSPNTGSVYS